jgi:hypothetical protein
MNPARSVCLERWSLEATMNRRSSVVRTAPAGFGAAAGGGRAGQASQHRSLDVILPRHLRALSKEKL